MTEEHKQKISAARMGHTVSDETRIKISNTLRNKNWNGDHPMLGKHPSDIARQKMSLSKLGRPLSESHKKKLSDINRGKTLSDEHKQKISNSHKNKIVTDATRHKMRMSAIARIENSIGQVSPNYNPEACRYFDRIMEETGTHIQHAENGGEFYIKELGYWVDGYDAGNNVVYEFDEPHHYRNGRLRERDVVRQTEIENHLHCGFIRISI